MGSIWNALYFGRWNRKHRKQLLRIWHVKLDDFCMQMIAIPCISREVIIFHIQQNKSHDMLLQLHPFQSYEWKSYFGFE